MDYQAHLMDGDGFYSRETCRACGERLDTLWDLGPIPIVGFPKPDEPSPPSAPLELTMCSSKACRLVQLRHTVPAQRLFHEYWYRSGTNESMVAQLREIVTEARRRRPVGTGDVVVDIGANDGTLLAQYKTTGECPTRVAYDPAASVQEELSKHCELLLPRFFPDSYSEGADTGLAAIITAIAMAYDLEDPNIFFAEVARILAPDGLFVLQVGYLGDLLDQNAFDSICHEHLEYYSLTSLICLLARHGLVVEEAAFNDTNGGSIRCYVRRARPGWHASLPQRIFRDVNQEQLENIHMPRRFYQLAERVKRLKQQTLELVDQCWKELGPVDVYGASTKGLTLLAYYGLDSSRIRWAADRNPIKAGRLYGATGIPIVTEERWRAVPRRPGYALVLPWHFEESIRVREKGTGQLFLFPLPHPKVLSI